MTPEEFKAHVRKNCECDKPDFHPWLCPFCTKLCECSQLCELSYERTGGELCWYCRWRLKVDA